MRRPIVRAALLIGVVAALAACSQPSSAPQNAPAPAVTSAPVTAGQLTVENAVARPPLGGQTTGVGYLVIRNTGDTADRLVGVASGATSSIELHTHAMTDGVMRMERVDGVDIPAHGEAVFKPRGLHLMLFNFAPPGAVAPVTLTFEMAGEVTVDFVVAAPGPGAR